MTVTLDGTWIDDVPSFYLALGEAINGPNGYFGGCLNALADCLCGGFGVLPPLTIYLSHFEEVRHALDSRASCRWRAESFRVLRDSGESTEQLVEWGYFDDGSEAGITRWTGTYEAALAGEPLDPDEFFSYFDVLLDLFAEIGVAFIPWPEEGNE